LFAFGYILPKEDLRIHSQTEIRTEFTAHYTVDTQRVIVTAVFPTGRRTTLLEAPAILGRVVGFDVSAAPAFEVAGEIAPSMSGGPVFVRDVLYGVVSRGLTERGEDGVDRDVAGIAMLLAPLSEWRK